MKLLMDEVRRIVKGRWRAEGENLTVRGVATDTRTAAGGELFVALRGENFDAHRFLGAAAQKGCLAAIVSARAPLDEAALGAFRGGVLDVEDPRAALGELARAWRRRLPATVVAVTGSNGKTTVKGMIHHILARRAAGLASPKSFNNNVGVPLTLLAAGMELQYVLCEVGTSAPGEIAALAALCQPDVAVITSVGPTHLEKLLSVEGVAVEKASLLGAMAPGGLAVVWADSPDLDRALKRYDVRRIRFGLSAEADLRLTGYEPLPGGGRFQLNGRSWHALSVPGRHMAVNALAAIAVAQRFGWAQDEAAAALADYAGADMRLQTLDLGRLTLVNDAYNANPASMRAAGEALAGFAGRRRVLVVGDMRELGPQALPLHRQVGRDLAAGPVDLLVGVGALGAEIAAAAAEAGRATAAFATVEAAAAGLPALLADGDVVLLKASRGLGLERLVEPIRAAFAGAANVQPDKATP